MGRRRKGGERGGSNIQQGTPRNTLGTSRAGLNASFVASTSNSHLHTRYDNGLSKSHFSLSEEARNTERHRPWNSDLKLRHSRISFVSAGTAKAEDLTQTPQEKPSEGKEDQTDETSEDDLKDANMPANPHPTINEATAPEIPMSKMSLRDGHDADVRMDDCESIPAGQLIERGPTNGTSSGDVFYIDIKGSQQPVHTGLPLPRVRRSRSPAASDSSEEIILFAGRNTSQVRTHTKLDPLQESANMPGDVLQQPSESLQGSPRFTTSLVDNFLNLAASPDPPVAKSSLGRRVKAGVTLAPAPSHHVAEMEESLSKRGGRTREKRLRKSVEEAEILNDYIANAHDSEDLEHFAENSGLNRRNLGGSDGDQWVNEEDVSATEPEQNTLEHLVDEWDSADLCDFDEISTSSEAPDAVDHILSKRNRLSGVQYLVVGVGFTRDDARWLPVSMLPTPDAIKEIRNFEEGQAEIERLFRSGDSSDNSLTIDERLISDLREDLDGLEDEQDLEERMKERMTDEQIARLLTKQEELGLGSSDLVLFNGDDLPDNHVEEAQTDGALGRPPASFQLQPRSKRSKSHQPSFPSATAFADVLDQDPYNGFDVMDQERPSLRKRSKGRRGKLDLELSDSDLEQTITAASETDRTKKKIRKQEREELRAQGLLGKKGKVDMKAKYSEGMSMDQVKAEIRDFLLSSMDSLPLPPMAQKERKIVHEIANVFKIKSKSIDSGKSRYPVLYRTARTLQYDESALKSIDAILSSNNFLRRLDKGKKRGKPTGKTRGGFATAGVSYRDGEIVGATAPELGQENKGRAMLEKMGWSTGKALGALNNTRGIVQPVAQVVKTGKAGLG